MRNRWIAAGLTRTVVVVAKEADMTKQDLIDAVAEATGLSKRSASDAVDAVLTNIIDGIRAEKRLSLSGFGTFTVRTRKGRLGRNPRTGEEIEIAPSMTVGFKPAPAMKAAL
jgi:DNA-binding protein HU-beta